MTVKVIFVLNHFLPKQAAGTEVYTFSLAKYLKEKGVSVKVVIPNKEASEFENYIFDEIDVHCYAEPTVVDRSIYLGFRKPDGLVHFSNFLDIEKPDVVHFQELTGVNGVGLEHVRLAKSKGFKVVMTFHLVGYSCKTSTLIKFGKEPCNGVVSCYQCSKCYLLANGMSWKSGMISCISVILKRIGIDTRRLYNPFGTLLGTSQIIEKLKSDLINLVNSCDRVVCLTDWYRDILVNNGVDQCKIKLIEQGVPKPLIDQDYKPDFNNPDPIKLIFIGRISRFKGVHLLIDALKLLSEKDYELSIFGNAEKGDKYEELLRVNSRKMKNVFWRGTLDQSAVIETIRKHHLLCLPSTISEMSPLVIQEAKAAGIPVLVSDVNGNIQQVNNGINGLCFENNNVNSLKENLEKFNKNKNLFLSYSSQIKQPKSFNSIGEDHISLYRETLSL